jgi:site-specific recombinase XerD
MRLRRIRSGIQEYLKLRRGLGYSLEGNYEGRLNDFVDMMEQAGADHITTALALRWAMQPSSLRPFTWKQRLGVLRKFAEYWRATDPRTEIPPSDLLAYRYHRKPPYIYSDEELARLLKAAREMLSPTGLRARTYHTLIALYAAAGLRLSEGIKLDRCDVDLVEGVLVINKSKFRKSRLVPLHETTRKGLLRYSKFRDRVHPKPSTNAFFLSEAGNRLSKPTVDTNFRRLLAKTGIRPRTQRRDGPRLHDLRHRFAVRTIMSWYRSGFDVDQYMPRLTTYLGHSGVGDTYWYLSAIPELLRLAADRVESKGRQ